MNLEDALLSMFVEARNNEIAPHNLYSTERVIQIAEQRNDKFEISGNLIIIEPETQPLEYAQFTQQNLCIMDSSKPDWGNFVEHMKPRGGKLFMIFEKNEGVNKKRMSPSMLHIAVPMNKTIRDLTGQDLPPEQIGQMMYQKAKQELGLTDNEMIYTQGELVDFATDLLQYGDNLWEIYNGANRLVKLSELDRYLTSNGSSLQLLD